MANNQGFSLNQKLMAVHETLKGIFNPDSGEEIQIAAELQDFFNWVFYGRTNSKGDQWNEGKVSVLQGVLTESLASQMQANLLGSLDMDYTGMSAKQKGDIAEKAFANALSQIFIANTANINKDIIDLMNTKGNNLISGAELSTVDFSSISDKAIKHMGEDIQKNLVNNNNYTRWTMRQGKSDIDASRLNLTGYLTGNAQKLAGLTATVKNYNSYRIHMEEVNIHKAYAAILGTLTDADDNTIDKLYNYYYQNNMESSNPEVTKHLTHIIKIYALTGYGQQYIDFNGMLQTLDYAKYLFFNSISNKQIIVRSTKEIVTKRFLDKGGVRRLTNAGLEGSRDLSLSLYSYRA